MPIQSQHCFQKRSYRMAYLLNEMGVFAKVVDHGGFGKAAEYLGMTRSAVSKHIARLEADLGVKLLRRTTRSMSLTEAGHAVYVQCARLIEAAEEAEAVASRVSTVPRGTLRISTAVSFGQAVVLPALPALLEKYPEVTVDIELLDRNVDLVEEGYDLVLRLTDHPADGLVARKLMDVHHVLCASPGYLAKRGHPETPMDLATHECIRHGQPRPHSTWRFEGAEGSIDVLVSGHALVASSLAARTLALAGVGCAVSPDFMVGQDMAEKRLVPLLPGYRVRGAFAHVYALYLPAKQGNPKVRAFIDWMLEVLCAHKSDVLASYAD